RDEGRTLPTLLRSLAVQGRAADEVIVVDDASSDDTMSVAESLGAKVVAAGPLPPGWTGKAWACAAGAEAASASLLVFLDADTELAAGGLERLVAEHAARGGRGLLSVAPYHVTGRPHERLSAVCNLVTLMGTGAFTPLGGWMGTRGSFGPCLVCRRADYEALGGHGSIRADMADDLGRLFRSAGLPVRMLGGRATLCYRMYPDGLGQLVEGWTKNLASGADLTHPAVMALVVAWVSGLVVAPVAAVRALRGGSGGRRPGPAVARYAAYALQVEWMLRRVGRFGRGTGLAYPAPLGAFLACFARSVWGSRRGGSVSWKGRAVRVAPASQRGLAGHRGP
ncbi:MAG: glycosyltransferase family 2 protein, partial [Acidimicrobiales bacterium]